MELIYNRVQRGCLFTNIKYSFDSIIFIFIVIVIEIGLGLELDYAEIAYCAGTSKAEVAEGVTQLFWQFSKIPADDSRSIMFSTWRDLEEVFYTCKEGRLPTADDGFDLVQQLNPAHLESLINSINLQPPMVSEAAIQEWARLSVELKNATIEFYELLDQQLIPGLAQVTNTRIPLSMPLEECIYLLFQLPLSIEVQAYYATHILYQVQPLLEIYPQLFGILPSSPEVLFVETIDIIENVDLDRSLHGLNNTLRGEAGVGQAIDKYQRAFIVAQRFSQLRHRIRKGLKRRRHV